MKLVFPVQCFLDIRISYRVVFLFPLDQLKSNHEASIYRGRPP